MNKISNWQSQTRRVLFPAGVSFFDTATAKDFKAKIKQENFPVGCLTAPRLKPMILAYYRAARQADDIADDPTLPTEEKLRRLDTLEKAFYTCTDGAAGALGQLFAAENLDYRLYADLLEAFRRDARGIKIEIWEQLLDYCRYSAAPVGRFMLALHNENPAAYLPAETLCAVLQITNHLRDIKTDACCLRRCYLPQDMMQRHGVAESDLCLDRATPSLRQLIGEIAERLHAMLKDAAVLPCLIRSRRLKCELGVIFSLTNSMLKKIKKGDVIARPPRLNASDWLKALSAGIWQGLFTRTKSCRSRLR